MLPVPTEFPYPTHYFSYEIFISEEEKWHPPILGRDTLFYEYAGAFGRFLAFNIQYWLASRTNPLQSFIVRNFFEKIFFFQDYVFPTMWLYFPWVALFFSYPIGIFQIQFEFYFPYFFFACSFISVAFFVFSAFFYVNRTVNDFFFIFFTLSYFFFSLPAFYFFSFPVFLFSTLSFFFISIFSFPVVLYFSEYVKFNFMYITFYDKRRAIFLPLPKNNFINNNQFSNVSSFVSPSSSFKGGFSTIFADNNCVRIVKKPRFTMYPFFNANLHSLKLSMLKNNYDKMYYHYSTLRFKDSLNDIRQFVPNEGPAVYNQFIPNYDFERIGLFPIYEELEELLETEIELEFGPDFEHSNDPFIPPEHYDEWEQLHYSHIFTPKSKGSTSSYIQNSSPDIDFDLRPSISLWLKKEAGRTWALKHWLRFLNPKYTNFSTSNSRLHFSTLYSTPTLSKLFKYFLSFTRFYFSVLDAFFNFFFSPKIFRTFSKHITTVDFRFYLISISKIERSLFKSRYLSSTQLLRVLFSLETFFIKNNRILSFEDKYLYFSIISRFTFFLYPFLRVNTKDFSRKSFISRCLISQLSRMTARKKS